MCRQFSSLFRRIWTNYSKKVEFYSSSSNRKWVVSWQSQTAVSASFRGVVKTTKSCREYLSNSLFPALNFIEECIVWILIIGVLGQFASDFAVDVLLPVQATRFVPKQISGCGNCCSKFEKACITSGVSLQQRKNITSGRPINLTLLFLSKNYFRKKRRRSEFPNWKTSTLLSFSNCFVLFWVKAFSIQTPKSQNPRLFSPHRSLCVLSSFFRSSIMSSVRLSSMCCGIIIFFLFQLQPINVVKRTAMQRLSKNELLFERMALFVPSASKRFLSTCRTEAQHSCDVCSLALLDLC